MPLDCKDEFSPFNVRKAPSSRANTNTATIKCLERRIEKLEKEFAEAVKILEIISAKPTDPGLLVVQSVCVSE